MANTVIASGSNSSMVDRPIWLQAKTGDAAITYNAADYRALVEAAFPTEGVLGAGEFKITQNGSGDGTVNIAAGRAVITGDGATNLGAYLVKSTGTVNATVPAAPTGVTRTHRAIARIRDSQLDSSTTYDWTLEILEDTGSGTPALPNSAINLGLVPRVGTNAVLTTAITDLRGRADRDPALPWGIIGGKTWANTGTLLNTIHDYALSIDSGPVTTVTGRRYRVTARFLSEVNANNATDVLFLVQDISGGSRLTYRVEERRQLGTTYGNHLVGEFDETAGAVRTYYVGAYQWTGGGGADHNILIYRHQAIDKTSTCVIVEDIGPAGAMTSVA